MSKPFLFPIKSGYPYWISQSFGKTPYSNQYTNKLHIGYDIAVVTGTPVVACADGQIIHTANGTEGYGVEIRYLTPTGNPAEFYLHTDAHLLKCLVGVGDTVTRGQVIALSDNTGMSTGAHLHHDIRVVLDKVGPGPQMAIGGHSYLVPDYNNGTYGCFDYGSMMDGLSTDVYPVDLRYGQTYSYLREASWALTYDEELVKKQALAVGFGTDELPRLKNAFVYGYHDKSFIFDTANYAVWRELTKPEYLKRLGK